MSADDVIKIIDAIPKYIEYVYPGYFTIYFFYFFKAKTIKDDKIIIIKSIMISYIYIFIVDSILNIIRVKADIPNLLNPIIVLVLAIICPYIWSVVEQMQTTQKILNKIGIHTTFYDNEIEVLSDFNKGAWLCIYLKDDNVVYEGALQKNELEDGKRKYICLSGYYKYFLGQDGKPSEPYIQDNANKNNEIVMIFYDSVKRIEKR